MMTWEELLARFEQPFYGNTVRQWAIAVIAAIGLFLLLKLIQAILVSRLTKLNERVPTDAGDLFVVATASIRLWFLLLVSLFAGSLLLALPPKTTAILNTLAILTVLFQAALTGNALLTRLIHIYSQRKLATDAGSVTTVTSLGVLARIALWLVVGLLVLQNLGINVTALVAGLGIGGIAVALAAQNVLGDLFASLSIVLDKPFVLGDFIIVGDQMGTVEKIGIKTTHLRSLSGEQLIISNADLLKSRIRNCRRMHERRIVFGIGVAYKTPAHKLANIPGMLREAVEKQEVIRFDRAHFKGFGASSLDFEVVYFVLSADFNLYMDIQQRINLLVYERLGAEGIEFAFPKPTVLLERPQPEPETAKDAAPAREA
ncbi:mechanosensitive ion channel family protein [Anatilimnocola sp. NA78]|uniref:mechanosensitive ion channel family protein n=1 Tax=Anatilimnocola sp. NA78 TaxID=3415683 RepID=UPI003CE5A19F